MQRTNLLSIALSSFTEEKTQGNGYRLYLLSHYNEDLLIEAQRKIKHGNAVVLYPDPLDKSISKPRKYKACFIQGGSLLKHSNLSLDKPFLYEVSIGYGVIKAETTLFDDITAQPDSANLINIALARAGIQLESSLFRMNTSLMREKVLPGLNNQSLTSFARSSFYARQLTQRELEQRIQPQVKKLFRYIINGEPDEVKKILNIDPYLSLKKWKTNEEKEQVIINKAGQHIYIQGKTGLQLALGEGRY